MTDFWALVLGVAWFVMLAVSVAFHLWVQWTVARSLKRIADVVALSRVERKG